MNFAGATTYGVGDGDTAASQSRALELSHHGASDRTLGGQCTALVGKDAVY
jgi:hypothetical protein